MTEHREGHDYAAANKQYFDENIEIFERPDMVLLTRRLANAAKDKYPSVFSADSTTLLDYACGPGTLSAEFSYSMLTGASSLPVLGQAYSLAS